MRAVYGDADETMKLQYPLDDQIIQRCKDEMDVNSHKGNSWLDDSRVTLPYLLNKLQEEYAEFVMAIKTDPSMVEKEGADTINILSMIMRRYRK